MRCGAHPRLQSEGGGDEPPTLASTARAARQIMGRVGTRRPPAASRRAEGGWRWVVHRVGHTPIDGRQRARPPAAPLRARRNGGDDEWERHMRSGHDRGTADVRRVVGCRALFARVSLFGRGFRREAGLCGALDARCGSQTTPPAAAVLQRAPCSGRGVHRRMRC